MAGALVMGQVTISLMAVDSRRTGTIPAAILGGGAGGLLLGAGWGRGGAGWGRGRGGALLGCWPVLVGEERRKRENQRRREKREEATEVRS